MVRLRYLQIKNGTIGKIVKTAIVHKVEEVDHQNSLWNSFANEKTRQEEEEIDALLLEAEEESAMDQFLLQAVDENEEQSDKDDLFLLHAAQYLP